MFYVPFLLVKKGRESNLLICESFARFQGEIELEKITVSEFFLQIKNSLEKKCKEKIEKLARNKKG